MAWKVRITTSAEKQIRQLDPAIQRRIVQFLRTRIAGSTDPRLVGKPLRGEKKGLWRYRVGAYRLICHIRDSELTVLVLHAGHRRNIYRL